MTVTRAAGIIGSCLLCDDVSVLDESVPRFSNACYVCETELQKRLAFDPSLLNAQDDAGFVKLVAKALSKARFPLVCGLVDQSYQVQQAAIRLARRFDAVIDWTMTAGNWPSRFHDAFQTCGFVSCTFEEIQQRADLVVRWSCDWQSLRPTFFEKFLTDKTILECNWSAQRQTKALRFLRGDDSVDVDDDVADLKAQLDQAKYVVFVIDESVTQSLDHAGLLSLFRFVHQQNEHQHCRLVHLGRHVNSAGIQSAMLSMTGAPFGVAFRKGQPTFRGQDFTTKNVLAQQQADAVVIVGDGASLAGIEKSSELQIFQFADACSELHSQATTLVAGRWGVDQDGTGIRSDSVPVLRQAWLQNQLPNMVELIDRV